MLEQRRENNLNFPSSSRLFFLVALRAEAALAKRSMQRDTKDARSAAKASAGRSSATSAYRHSCVCMCVCIYMCVYVENDKKGYTCDHQKPATVTTKDVIYFTGQYIKSVYVFPCIFSVSMEHRIFGRTRNGHVFRQRFMSESYKSRGFSDKLPPPPPPLPP